MQYKVRQLVVSALMRNEQLKKCDLSVKVQGYDVTVYGAVNTAQEYDETIHTIQSVSPWLKIDTQMEIKNPKLAKV